MWNRSSLASALGPSSLPARRETIVRRYLQTAIAGFASVKTANTVDTVQERPPRPLFTPIINQKLTVRTFLIYYTMFILFPAKDGTKREDVNLIDGLNTVENV